MVESVTPLATVFNPDLAQARAYLEALTGEAEPVVTFQTFSDAVPKPKPDPLARFFHGTLSQHAAELASRNDAGAGIFVMVNAGDLKGRSACNVVAVRALFDDEDGAPARPYALAPSFVVRTSAEKKHAYWLPRGVVPLSEFRPTQKRLIAYYGSDPAVHDLNRVMRLTGFFHRKKEPRLVTFELWSGLRYTLGQILAAHPLVVRPRAALPPSSRVRSTSTDADDIVREKVLDVADRHSWATGDRHASGKDVAAYARKLGLDGADILSIVRTRLVAAGKDEEEAADIVDWSSEVAVIPADRERVVRFELRRRGAGGAA